MNQVQIIDNFLPEDQHQHIYNILTNQDTLKFEPFAWYLSSSVATTHDTPSNNFYLYHLFYANDTPSSEYLQMLSSLINQLEPKSLMRIKGNLYPSTSTIIEHDPHVDLDFSHKSAVYYVNSNDGFTILEDGTRIESKANRILLFDASKPHQSTTCTNDKFRVTINFNYF